MWHLSIQATDVNRNVTISGPPGVKLHAENISLEQLIQIGWGISNVQVTGVPNWLQEKRWYIDAKGPGEATRIAHLQLQIQALLKDRFALAVHEEMREVNQLAMLPAKDGLRIRDTSEGDGKFTTRGRAFMDGVHVSMPVIVRSLSDLLGVPVLNLTGHDTFMDIHMEFLPHGEMPRDDLPGIETALREQYGIELKMRKAPLRMLVVDRVELPTEN